jgi:membrane protein YdbS with pleckstrin-like domain
MKRNTPHPQFSSRRRAAQWLGCRLVSLFAAGVIAFPLATSSNDFLFVVVAWVMALALVLQLRIQPPQPRWSWRGERAVTMAAGIKLRLNSSLIWIALSALNIVISVGLIVALVIRWS